MCLAKKRVREREREKAVVEFFRRRGLVWKMRGLRGLCVFEEHLPFFVTSAPLRSTTTFFPEIATAWFRRRATERTTGTRIIKLIAPCEHSRRLPHPRFENYVAWSIFSVTDTAAKSIHDFRLVRKFFPRFSTARQVFSFFNFPTEIRICRFAYARATAASYRACRIVYHWKCIVPLFLCTLASQSSLVLLNILISGSSVMYTFRTLSILLIWAKFSSQKLCLKLFLKSPLWEAPEDRNIKIQQQAC